MNPRIQSLAEDQYRREVAALQEVKAKCPHVPQEFVLELAAMDRQELQRRVLIQYDHLGHLHRCLDGIKEIRNIPGGGTDGTRDSRDIRNTVLILLQECPITWQNTFQGEPKPKTLEEQVREFRKLEAVIRARKANTFKSLGIVKVEAPSYKGYGVTRFVSSSDVQSDKIAVTLENGNTWHYPVECCTPAKWTDLHRIDRLRYLRIIGIQCGGALRFVTPKLP